MACDAGNFECDDRVKIGKPENVFQLQEMVSHFDKVKAVGVGHSWWKEQFCSGANDTSINVVMTELDDVRQL